MGYPGQIDFDLLQAKGKGWVPEVKVFLQEISETGRAGSRVVEVKGFHNVRIGRSINAKGKAQVTFANIDDRIFQGGVSTPKVDRKYVLKNSTLTKKALTSALRRGLPYVREINPTRRVRGIDGFPAQLPLGDRINEYLDFVYNFTGTQGVILRNGLFTQTGSRNVDMITLGLMQRIYIDIYGQDGLAYAGFSGTVASITDEVTPGMPPGVSLNCYDNWRLFEISEIIMKQGVGVEDAGNSGNPNARDTIFFDVQERLGLKVDDHRASPFDDRPGKLILLDVMRLTQNALCFIPNLQLKLALNPNELPPGVFGPPGPAGEVSAERPKIEILRDAQHVETRGEFFFDDPFWVLPEESSFSASYEGHENLRRHQAGISLIPEVDADGNELKDSRGQNIDKLIYVDPKRPPGSGIRDRDLVGNLTGRLLVDKFIDEGTQAIVYQLLIKNVLGPWQIQYATGMSVLKKLADATLYDIYCTGNGDVVYQIPRYNNFPGEYAVSLKETKKKISLVDISQKSGTADATANPENGGDVRVSGTALAADSQSPKSPAEKTKQIIDDTKSGKTSIPDATVAQAQVTAQSNQEASKAPGAKEAAAKNSQAAGPDTQSEITEITTDYGGLEAEGLYDYSPDPRYPIKYHGFNYVITDIGLRRWNIQVSEEPIVTALRIQGGANLITLGDTLQNGSATGYVSLLLTRKLQQRFGVRPRTSQQIFIPDLFSDIGNANILLNAYASGLLQQLNSLGDTGQLSLSPRPDLELGHNVMATERQKLYYITGVDFQWSLGKEASTSLNLTHGHDWAEEIPNPWGQVNLVDLLTKAQVSRDATAVQGSGEAGDTQNRTKFDPGKKDIWAAFIWPMPTLSYRGVAKYANAKQSDGFHPRKKGFHYGSDIMYARRPNEPKYANNGSKGHFCPNGVPVYCIGPGKIMSVLFSSSLGWNVTVDHRNIDGFGKLITFYQHLTYYNSTTNPTPDPTNGQSAGTSTMKPFVEKGQEVQAGTVLGYAGRAPRDGSTRGLVHLHFEMWNYTSRVRPQNKVRSQDAFDPLPVLGLLGRRAYEGNLDGSAYLTQNGEDPFESDDSFE